MKLEKIILEQAANYAAKLATNGITVFLQRWRFYFDENDREKMIKQIKDFLLEVSKMQLIESNRLLSTCKRCGLKFEVNSLITYPLYCPKCDFNKRAEDFNKGTI